MLSKDLIELIKQIRKNGSEDNRIEIKKAAGGCPKIYDTLSSFSNHCEAMFESTIEIPIELLSNERLVLRVLALL
ncbi:hypothetical protein [Ruminococcus sp.]|uniref:hypothetical protein n=1 Tax=Ruminococcus sp. TaxID=41978 RepID=UPI002E8114A2|nr:hypothetical protein [Ruminococcus sp.]MEE3440000.1 hypothetical protein [Ruminococcus sp.]